MVRPCKILRVSRLIPSRETFRSLPITQSALTVFLLDEISHFRCGFTKVLSMKFVLFVLAIPLISPASYASAVDGPADSHQVLQRARYLADLYNWVDAGPEFARAERMFIASGDKRNSLYAHLGRLRATMIEGAIPKTSALLANKLADDPILLSDKDLRLFCLVIKADFDEAFDHFENARDWREISLLAQQLHDAKWQYRALAALGIAAYYEGNIPEARARVAKALLGATKIGDVAGEVRDLAIISEGMVEAKMYEQAIGYADKALALSKSNPDMGYGYVPAQFKLRALIALKQFDAASQLSTEILRYAREKRRPELEAEILGLDALTAEAKGDLDGAVTLLRQAIHICDERGFIKNLSGLDAMLANVYVKKGELPLAENAASSASHYSQLSGDIEATADRLRVLGQVETARGRYHDADRSYDRAEAFVEALVARSAAAMDRRSIVSSASEVFAQHFSLLADHMSDAPKAFSVIEQVRGRIMTDLLISGSRTTQPEEITEREARGLRLKLASANSTVELKHLNSQMFSLQEAPLAGADLRIHNPNKRYTLADVRRGLSGNTVVLEYVIADPKSYCLVITRGSHRIVPLPGAGQLDPAIESFAKALRDRGQVRAQGRDLFKWLLLPIPEVQQHEYLVIVSDGRLHDLPFDALVDYDGKYLAENHVIEYAPSATSYVLLSQKAQRESALRPSFFGVGGVLYDKSDLKPAALTRGYDSARFKNLPTSMNEVEAGARAFRNSSTKLLSGPEATETAVKRTNLEQYRILHLAVHGIANRNEPDRAALVLLGDAANGEDGFLEAPEVLHLRLRAELVVLSACETAVGPIQGEEGIATLSRAFLVAGANAVISTLWPVDDTTSLFLMKRFYKYLGNGRRPSQSLSLAKRDMLRELGDAMPFYWAAYIFEGADTSNTSEETSDAKS